MHANDPQQECFASLRFEKKSEISGLAIIFTTEWEQNEDKKSEVFTSYRLPCMLRGLLKRKLNSRAVTGLIEEEVGSGCA